MERLRERESVLHDAVPRGSLEFKIPYLFRTSWKKDAVRGRSLTGEATVMVWRWEDVEMEERQWRSHVSLSTKYIPTL